MVLRGIWQFTVRAITMYLLPRLALTDTGSLYFTRGTAVVCRLAQGWPRGPDFVFD